VGKYRLLIKPSAAKEIEAIPRKKDRQRIVNCIQALAENPRPSGCEKLSGQRNRYRVREGYYRILYSVEDKGLLVYIVKVGHRKEVYR
jgi:mRNA interferase RelE/StbE